jgi:cytidine deaminase
MIKQIFKEIKLSEIENYQKKMLSIAYRNLNKQTLTWHNNSVKRVSACAYIKERNLFFCAQNIGISKVTGTLCAERSVIAVAISKIPDLEIGDITDILIIGEVNPILPCGVCSEWIIKVNPNMNILALRNEYLILTNISCLYIDENNFEKRLINGD